MAGLQLGWCMGYKALEYHMEEALIEKGRDLSNLSWSPPVAIFSRKYYQEIMELDHKKIYDFCFIGSIQSNPQARKWIIDFAKKHFTDRSVFINTDRHPQWKLLGSFDYSHVRFGFCPKHQANNQSRQVQYRVVSENMDYFQTMCQSRYVLCPAGDAPWSFRFYEVLMCGSLPIVESMHHTYRTPQEAEIPYRYVLANDVSCEDIYEEAVKENTRIFEEYHLLH